jgi:hypothetical protein
MSETQKPILSHPRGDGKGAAGKNSILININNIKEI